VFWAALAPRTSNTGRLRWSCSSIWSTPSPPRRLPPTWPMSDAFPGVRAVATPAVAESMRRWRPRTEGRYRRLARGRVDHAGQLLRHRPQPPGELLVVCGPGVLDLDRPAATTAGPVGAEVVAAGHLRAPRALPGLASGDVRGQGRPARGLGTPQPMAGTPAKPSRRLYATVSVVEAVREDRCQALALAPRYDSLCNWHPMGCLQV
jgi:hypothetical protein